VCRIRFVENESHYQHLFGERNIIIVSVLVPFQVQGIVGLSTFHFVCRPAFFSRHAPAPLIALMIFGDSVMSSVPGYELGEA
jgi:hypothetical protein